MKTQNAQLSWSSRYIFTFLCLAIWRKKNKKLQIHQQMSVSSSVHLSTIQKVSKWVYKFDISPVSQSTIQTVSLPVINQATQLINQTLFHQWINRSNSYSTVQKLVDSLLQVLILDAIHDSRFLPESRIRNRELKTSYRQSSRGSSLAGQKTKDSPMPDFLIILHRDTAVTQHSMVILAQATVCAC